MKILFLLLFVATLFGGEVEIVFTGDLHGKLNRLAHLAPHIRRHHKSIKIDLGDLVQGDFYADYTGGKIMIEALNSLKYDFWVPGNHDFETDYAKFKWMAENFRGKVLGANWLWNSTFGIPWVMVRRNKIKCAIIGLTEFRMPKRQLPDLGMRFENYRIALKLALDEIRKKEPQIVVLATHNGQHFGNDTMSELSKDFPEIDLILGAHTHEEFACKRVGTALLVQTGSRGSSLGVVKIITDDTSGKIIDILPSLKRPVAKPDRQVFKIWLKARQESEHVANRVVGTFVSPKVFGMQMAKNMRFVGKSDVALFLSGRWFPPQGAITIYTRYRLLPYNNQLLKVTISATEWGKLQQEFSKRGIHFYTDGTPKDDYFTLAISDYALLISSTLKKYVKSQAYSRIGCLEREVF